MHGIAKIPLKNHYTVKGTYVQYDQALHEQNCMGVVLGGSSTKEVYSTPCLYTIKSMCNLNEILSSLNLDRPTENPSERSNESITVRSFSMVASRFSIS